MPATAPTADMGARLDRLEDSLERIESALAALAPVGPPARQIVDEAPRLAAIATDVADGFIARIPDADARVRALLALMLRVSRPETLDRLGAALDLLDRAPQAVAATVDIFDAVLATAAAEGIDVNAFFGVAGRFAVHLVRLGPAIDRLLDSGMLDPRTIDALGRVGRAVAAQSEADTESVGGLFALLKVLKDPAVQQSLGFAVGIARHFGAADAPATR